jgi:hypothetical protein
VLERKSKRKRKRKSKRNPEREQDRFLALDLVKLMLFMTL